MWAINSAQVMACWVSLRTLAAASKALSFAGWPFEAGWLGSLWLGLARLLVAWDRFLILRTMFASPHCKSATGSAPVALPDQVRTVTSRVARDQASPAENLQVFSRRPWRHRVRRN